jgi:hypothetical protein
MRSKQRRSVRPQRLARRTFLRGALGTGSVCVGLPLLDIMLNDHADALAGGKALPQRFGIFYWGGGIVHSGWVPAETGMDWTLPYCLEPFADVRELVTLVTGTNHRGSSPGHIPARGIALSNSHDPDTSIEGVGTWRGQNHPEPSADAIVAQAFNGSTPFSSVEIGICRTGPYRSNSSWQAGGSNYNRHEEDPVALYDRLFGGAINTPDPDYSVLGASQQMSQSMLDVVMEDAADLSARLGATDKQRIEQHLDGLREIERRLQDFTASCTAPDAPQPADYQDGSTNEQKEPKAQLMSDLLAVALACDLTRVFSYEFSGTQSTTHYWEVGVNMEHHEYNHQEPGGQGMLDITRFIMSNFGYLADALAAMPEGGGSVLDNSLIVGTSEHAIAGNHNYTDHPFIMLGGAGGRIRAGMHYRHPNPGGNNDCPKAMLTAIRAVGVPLESYGQAGGPGGVADRIVYDSITELEA